ncbi:MAG TPA: lysozyme inhibitor LprI family protein [Alphaproteobacteria bacterium]|jgi:uncharacterized protein|nr:lysozyme inhibitor LprI family protein [Alphaproteobacteria bacterium]
MIRHVLTYPLLCLALAPAAGAASFDCSSATSKVEKTICSAPRLSAQDDRMAAAYRAVIHNSADTDALKARQRAWLHDTRTECEDSPEVAKCLGQAYARRDTLLVSLAAFLTVADTQGARFDIGNASKTRDFTIRMMKACDPPGPDGGSCEGPAIVDISAKGAAQPIETIAMENIVVRVGKHGKPLINSTELYDDQGVINTGDFNFDGREDFAVQNGNDGSYGGPSYDVYLASADGTYTYSVPFSDLIQQSLGFFTVDAKTKHLVTLSKDGCCHHETTDYAVTDDKPLPVSRIVDDADGETTGTRTEQKMVDGNWQTVRSARYTAPAK